MCSTENNQESGTNATGATGTLALQHICLDFQFRRDRHEARFVRFLEQHRERLQLTDAEDLAGAYLDRVWPDDLQGTCIIANASLGQYPQWLIRPVTDGPLAASYAAGHLAPAFHIYRRQGVLVVTGFEVAPHVPPRPFEALLSGIIHVNPAEQWMTPDDFATLASLPWHRQETDRRLEIWRECLDWREKLAHIGQIALRYKQPLVTEDGTILFPIRDKHPLGRLRRKLAHAKVLVAPLAASQSQDRWEPAPNKRPRLLNVGKVIRVEAVNGDPAGEFENKKVQHVSGQVPEEDPVAIIIEVARDESGPDTPDIPEADFLITSIGGDLKPIANERLAIERCRNSQSFQPYLAGCLFDIRNAAQPETVDDIFTDSEPMGRLNEDQRAAVNKAMAAMDIFLIQGPPGTGKTTVIVEICHQYVRLGYRCLVVAQTNLAVDNVFSRLTRRAEMRPLRVAQADRVEKEFQHFLEENVVVVWFQTIRGDCQRKLQHGDMIARQIVAAEEGFVALQHILQQVGETREQIASLEQRRADLQGQRDSQLEAMREAQGQRDLLIRQQNVLAELVSWFTNPDINPPTVDGFANEPVVQLLNEVAGQVGDALAGLTWSLSWLPSSAPSALTASVGIIHWARQATQAARELEGPAFEAVSLCREQLAVTSVDGQRLQELQAEKARLTDSENEQDLVQVARINREIKNLREDRWSVLCRAMLKPLKAIFQNQLPQEIEDCTSALQPQKTWSGTLELLHRFSVQVREGIESIHVANAARLETLTAAEVASIQDQVVVHDDLTRQAKQSSEDIEVQISQIEEQLERAGARLHECQQRWSEIWPDVCPDLCVNTDELPAADEEVLRIRQESFNVWRQDHASEHERHYRFRPILVEWIDRLGNASATDRPVLQSLYVKHANVTGITCYEAGQRDFYDRPDFEPFDVVIIDEVSKATPPELLMPMLLGRKVIPVGDHRQLSPMFREQEASYEEAMEEGLINPEDFERYRNLVTSSFFAELFEAAPDVLKHTLRQQYRMHPQIMAAVNQFYDGQLIDGFSGEQHD